MEDKEINDRLRAIEKAEQPLQKYLFQLITIAFLAGGGWLTLDSVKAMAEDNEAAIEHETQKTNEIDKKLVRIETTQEQIKRELEKAAKTAEENQRKLDQILNKLED